MKSVTLPLSADIRSALRIGDELLLSGSMLVARDQAHSRICGDLERGAVLPVELRGATIYYMGPAPAPEGRIIGSCGPTTSARMDRYTPQLLDAGASVLIGKGPRASNVADSIAAHGAVYFAAFGGCGALYAECVTELELLAYKDLGPEALYRITVRDFPVITAIDTTGRSIYETTTY